jgi:hypothetical protein
MMMRVAS